MKKILFLFALFVLWFSSISRADNLVEIQKSAVLRVGTTGDYQFFSQNNNTNYSGYDIDVANYFAKQMGVTLKIVPTTRENMIKDLNENKFDIAMGGIVKSIEHQFQTEQTQGYFTFGKCFLVGKGKGLQFDSIEKVNQANVIVGFTTGSDDETFTNTSLAKARIIPFEDKTSLLEALATSKIDVMVTKTHEALYNQNKDQRLEAVSCFTPFTKNQFSYLVPKGEQSLLNMINYLMDEIKFQNLTEKFKKDNSIN